MAHNGQRIIDHVRLVRRLCRKAADLLRRKRQLERGLDRLIAPERGICTACGARGAHFVPPMFGEDGFFICRARTVGFDIESRPLRLGLGAKAANMGADAGSAPQSGPPAGFPGLRAMVVATQRQATQAPRQRAGKGSDSYRPAGRVT